LAISPSDRDHNDFLSTQLYHFRKTANTSHMFLVHLMPIIVLEGLRYLQCEKSWFGLFWYNTGMWYTDRHHTTAY